MIEHLPECPVCEGAGWDWVAYNESGLQLDDPVLAFPCPRCARGDQQ